MSPYNNRKLSSEKSKDTATTANALLSHCVEGLAILSETGEFLYATESVQKILGYTSEEILNLEIYDLLKFQKKVSFQQAIDASLNEKDSFIRLDNFQLQTKENTWLWFEGSLKNKCRDKNLNGLVFNFRDITALKKSVETVENFEKLQIQKSNLEAMLNSGSEGFILTDTYGLIIEFNRNAQNISNKYLFKLLEIGVSLFDFLPTNKLKFYKSYFSNDVSEETINYIHSDHSCWSITIAAYYNLEVLAGYCFSFRDISKSKEAELKLIESELFSKSVLSSLSEQIAVVNIDGTIVAVNKSWDDFASENGVKKSSNTSVGSNYFSVCRVAIDEGDMDVKKTLDGIKSVFDKKAPSFHLEYPCNVKQVKRWFMLNVLPFGNDDSKVVISHQEITIRKLAEENLNIATTKLKSSLKEFSTILNSSIDLICTINEGYEFVIVNKASKNILGYEPEEMVGKNLTEFVFIEDIESTMEVARKIAAGNSITFFENRYIHKNGSIIPLLWSVNWDENCGITYCVAKDITEKKRFEKAILNERDRFYDMFHKAPSSVGMLRGPNHIFEMANPLYLQLIGKTDVLGKTVEEVLPEVVNQGFIKILDHVYETGETYVNKEHSVKVDMDGTGVLQNYYINFVYQAYTDYEGKIQGVFFFINDVTEQVVAKLEIAKSEKFFKGMIESSHDMIATLDGNGSILYASPSVSKIYGFRLDEIINLNFMNVVHPDDISIMRDFRVEVLRKSGIPIICPVVRQRKKDGNYMWIEATLTNFLHTDGINAIVVNFRDITERKMAESMLTDVLFELESERTRLVTAQKVAKTGSWETDTRTFKANWSDETYRLFGAGPRSFEASYEAFLSFIHPDDKEMVDKNFVNTLNGKGQNSMEHRIITLQGVEKWIDEKWNITRDQNGVALLAIGTCQDITERKKAAEKVLKSETKLKIAQQIAQVGSWEVNIKTKEQSWSDEFYRILEIDTAIEPSTESFFSKIHPDDISFVLKNVEEANVYGEDSSFIFRFIRKNGEIGYASTEWKTELDYMGFPSYMYGILRDLTKEKKEEEEKQKMIIDIIQRNKDLEQFSYIISHNLRSPVANIIGLTEELKDDTHSAETKMILRDAIGSDVRRLENVIADLNIILQTKREITERKEDVSLSKLVNNIKLSISDLVQGHGITIITDFEEIDTIQTIKSYMQSILYNLLTNSIKYRKSKGNLLIEIRTHLENNKVKITFKDNGTGIDLIKNGSLIFGLYRRFHPHTEGKGMGLYMVKTQVEAIGGKISVNSQVDAGTEFIIEFSERDYF
ncbi:MAG: PAS domain S-box protein [Flavobacterium sp.]